MYDLFATVKGFLARKAGTIIDNSIFRLHYKITSGVMIAFCLVVSAYQYIGDPIDCFGLTPNSNELIKILDEYCWIHGTFTLPKALGSKIGEDVAHPGIEKYVPGDERKYHTYYQWVCFILFFQAMAFYLPHYIWKIWEGGRLNALLLDLKCPTLQDDSKNKSVDCLVTYFVKNLHHHQFYVTKFVLCELLNFLNVILQIYATDVFLKGEFSTYGLDVFRFMNMDQEDRVDPMVKVFPKMTKCTFHFYGSSGDVQKQDVLCILPLNIVNEKIYIFLWFWYIALAVVTGIQIGYRILIVILPRMRYMVLRTRARIVPTSYLQVILSKAQIGDWFVMYQLSKNMESLWYREFLIALAKRIDPNGENKNLVV